MTAPSWLISTVSQNGATNQPSLLMPLGLLEYETHLENYPRVHQQHIPIPHNH
jgi:hypothetical protein